MLRFHGSLQRWWQKPLADVLGKPILAELAVLRAEPESGEAGAWINSRGTTSGVVDVVRGADGRFNTVRVKLPPFVSKVLASLYEMTKLTKGAPDLVVWNEATGSIRFIEVKCPHWDYPSKEATFMLPSGQRPRHPTVVCPGLSPSVFA